MLTIALHVGADFFLVVMANVGVHAQEAFQVLSNASLTHYEVAYVAMFAIPLVERRGCGDSFPAWLKWTSVAGLGSTVFSLLISAYPFVDVVNPMGYAAKIVCTLIVSNLVAYSFYRVRMRAGTSSVDRTRGLAKAFIARQWRCGRQA